MPLDKHKSSLFISWNLCCVSSKNPSRRDESFFSMRRFFRVPTTNLTVSVHDNEVTLKILIYLDIFYHGDITLRIGDGWTRDTSNEHHNTHLNNSMKKGTYSVNVLVFLNSCRYHYSWSLDWKIEPGQMVPMAYLILQSKHILQSSRGTSRWDAPSEYHNECFRANLFQNAVNWTRLVVAFISKEIVHYLVVSKSCVYSFYTSKDRKSRWDTCICSVSAGSPIFAVSS